MDDLLDRETDGGAASPDDGQHQTVTDKEHDLPDRKVVCSANYERKEGGHFEPAEALALAGIGQPGEDQQALEGQADAAAPPAASCRRRRPPRYIRKHDTYMHGRVKSDKDEKDERCDVSGSVEPLSKSSNRRADSYSGMYQHI